MYSAGTTSDITALEYNGVNTTCYDPVSAVDGGPEP
jgi:hypothetical protein